MTAAPGMGVLSIGSQTWTTVTAPVPPAQDTYRSEDAGAGPTSDNHQ